MAINNLKTCNDKQHVCHTRLIDSHRLPFTDNHFFFLYKHIIFCFPVRLTSIIIFFFSNTLERAGQSVCLPITAITVPRTRLTRNRKTFSPMALYTTTTAVGGGQRTKLRRAGSG